MSTVTRSASIGLRRSVTLSGTEFDVSRATDLPKVDILYSYVQPSVGLAKSLVAEGVRRDCVRRNGRRILSTAEREALRPLLELPDKNTAGAGAVESDGSGR